MMLVAQANLAALTRMQESWKRESGIPGWKRDAMVALTDKLRRRVEDNHNELDGVELYYPEDCSNYDVFMTVAYALDALVVPRSNGGGVMRKFGEYGEDVEVE